jgi:SPP1 gp7 family putative phage head morphogenesis protein
MAEVTPHDLPFDEAIAHFRAKGLQISPNSWRDVWQEANARSFTVTRVTAMDVLGDVKAEAQKAFDSGISLGEFKKNLIPMLQQKGWLAPKGELPEVLMPDGTVRKRLTPWRLETIYRTNLQSAYSVGRYQQMTEMAESRPYWQYRAIMDSRTRPRHAAMNGKVYDYQHPIWNSWYPPNGFNCRCYVKSLSRADVEERDLEISTKGVDAKPDEGWNYNVGKEGLKARWDKNGLLPDCLDVDFADGNCIRIKPGQRTWKDFGRPDLRNVEQRLRQEAPETLAIGRDREEAEAILRRALDLNQVRQRMIETPIERVVLSADWLGHMVEDRQHSRERYGLYVLPTLINPFEIYLTEYDDGPRSRYIGLFTGKENLMTVARINRDGSLLWNVMQAKDKAMNRRRVGELLWPK